MYELLLPTVRPPAPRYEVTAQAILRYEHVSVDVEVHDISIEGLKVATDLTLAVGSQVLISLPGQQSVDATVRWTRDGFAGLRFANDLPEAQVAEIAGI